MAESSRHFLSHPSIMWCSTQRPKEASRLPLERGLIVDEVEIGDQPVGGGRRLGGVRVRVVDGHVSWLLPAPVGSGGKVAHRWSTLQALSAQV